METLSEVVALPRPSSEVDAVEETQGDIEGQEEEQSEAVVNDESGQPTADTTIASNPGSLAQSTLVAYRTPVLPNLAQAALERLQKRGSAIADLEDSPNSDFQPLKRRRVDENAHSAEGDENEVAGKFK